MLSQGPAGQQPMGLSNQISHGHRHRLLHKIASLQSPTVQVISIKVFTHTHTQKQQQLAVRLAIIVISNSVRGEFMQTRVNRNTPGGIWANHVSL